MSDTDTRADHVERFLASLRQSLETQGVRGVALVNMQDAAAFLIAVKERDEGINDLRAAVRDLAEVLERMFSFTGHSALDRHASTIQACRENQ